MEEKELTLEQESQIKKKAKEIKEKNPNIQKVIPIVIFGDDGDEKPLYVGYFKKPDIVSFSKCMSLVKKDEVKAMRALAKDCFVEGDTEMVDNDNLFLFGTMNQLSVLLETRSGKIVNF